MDRVSWLRAVREKIASSTNGQLSSHSDDIFLFGAHVSPKWRDTAYEVGVIGAPMTTGAQAVPGKFFSFNPESIPPEDAAREIIDYLNSPEIMEYRRR